MKYSIVYLVMSVVLLAIYCASKIRGIEATDIHISFWAAVFLFKLERLEENKK